MTVLTDTQVITASGGLVELGYSAITTPGTVTSTTAGTGTQIISPLTVVCDGSPILVEFRAPATTSPPSGTVNISLYQDGTENIRQWGQQSSETFAQQRVPTFIQTRLTPSAGVHTFGVYGYNSSGTSVIQAGSGGSTTAAPAFLRVSKIVQATQWPAVTTGTIICTSSTRPASPFAGQQIYETDTSKSLIYNGTAWVSPQAQTVPPMASVYRSAALSHTSSGAYQSIAWDTEQFANTNSIWSAGAPTRLTLSTAGIYTVTATITFTGSAGAGLRAIRIDRNGAAYAYGQLILANTSVNYMNMSALVESDGSHYVEAIAYQDVGVSLAYSVGSASMRFGCAYVGKKA